jgi:hypothetical protein
METKEFYMMTVGYMPKHKRIQRQCGTRMAALYLKNRGLSLQQAINLLALKGV